MQTKNEKIFIYEKIKKSGAKWCRFKKKYYLCSADLKSPVNMSLFSGSIEVRLDVKGRLFIPAPYRRILTEMQADKLYLRSEPGLDCLTVFPAAVWRERLDSLTGQLDDWNADDLALLIQLNGEAEEVQLDGQGRLLLTKKHLQAIGSTGQELLIIGLMNRFTIWDKKVYENFRLSSKDLSRAIAERLAQNKNK